MADSWLIDPFEPLPEGLTLERWAWALEGLLASGDQAVESFITTGMSKKEAELTVAEAELRWLLEALKKVAHVSKHLGRLSSLRAQLGDALNGVKGQPLAVAKRRKRGGQPASEALNRRAALASSAVELLRTIQPVRDLTECFEEVATVFNSAGVTKGGRPLLRSTIRDWHTRCMADDVLKHVCKWRVEVFNQSDEKIRNTQIARWAKAAAEIFIF